MLRETDCRIELSSIMITKTGNHKIHGGLKLIPVQHLRRQFPGQESMVGMLPKRPLGKITNFSVHGRLVAEYPRQVWCLKYQICAISTAIKFRIASFIRKAKIAGWFNMERGTDSFRFSR